MVALRKKGMYERHWSEITSKVGFEVKPTEDFTFTNVFLLYKYFSKDFGTRAVETFRCMHGSW